MTGDLVDEDGEHRTEDMECWFRDVIGCVKELMGNPTFREALKYAPCRLYADAEGNKEIINETSTAKWWWEMQVSLTFTKQ